MSDLKFSINCSKEQLISFQESLGFYPMDQNVKKVGTKELTEELKSRFEAILTGETSIENAFEQPLPGFQNSHDPSLDLYE